LLGTAILVVLLAIAGFYATNAYLFWKMGQIGKSIGLHEGHVYYSMLSEQRFVADMLFALFAVLSVVAVIIFGIRVSHRIAGPIHRLKTELFQASQGKPFNELKFREKDCFPELADAYNTFARSRSRPRDV
jgi:hypothetical protein